MDITHNSEKVEIIELANGKWLLARNGNIVSAEFSSFDAAFEYIKMEL